MNLPRRVPGAQHVLQPFTEPCRLTVEFGEHAGRSLAARLIYDPANPYDARLEVRDDTEVVAWTFARDLLRDGLHTPSGQGDICIGPLGQTHTLILLRNDQGEHHFSLPRSVVARWVARSYQLVPAGAEDMGQAVEDALVRILKWARS